ncbi:hypothetical protein [Bradyrhizobium sp. ERR14]|uniref:hypothetical protein n=1 Tax=Bradyrhizobium sp. ERR14 TaxID=2663837 RepID=UPI0017B4C8B8|nr:hypothetical protein [Bradyrhizobium sp. ERR14]MBB4397938.1 hypothetical protein [Bradyrhizobium sp. ERR14]
MSKKPTMIAYTVKDRGNDKKPFWVRVGAAWPLKEKPGFSIELDAMPVDGRIILIEPNADDDSSGKGSNET